MYKLKYLNSAKVYLSFFKTGCRCIFQVKENGVIPDPHKIAGYPQLKSYGFNKYWNNDTDIRHMYVVAAAYSNEEGLLPSNSNMKDPSVAKDIIYRGRGTQYSSSPDCKTRKNKKGKMKCDTKHNYCFYNPRNARVTKQNFYSKCCDKLACKNAVTSITGGTSFKECCTNFHQGSRLWKWKFPKYLDLKFIRYNDHGDKTIHVYLL